MERPRMRRKYQDINRAEWAMGLKVELMKLSKNYTISSYIKNLYLQNMHT
jgi:hypothetical protein